jgi:hypothetical protein
VRNLCSHEFALCSEKAGVAALRRHAGAAKQRVLAALQRLQQGSELERRTELRMGKGTNLFYLDMLARSR